MTITDLKNSHDSVIRQKTLPSSITTDVNSDLLRVCQPQCERTCLFEQGKVITFTGLLLDLSIACSHKFLESGDDGLFGMRTASDRAHFLSHHRLAFRLLFTHFALEPRRDAFPIASFHFVSVAGAPWWSRTTQEILISVQYQKLIRFLGRCQVAMTCIGSRQQQTSSNELNWIAHDCALQVPRRRVELRT